MSMDETEIYPGFHEWDYEPLSEETELEEWMGSCGLQPDNTCEYVGSEGCEFECPWHQAVKNVSAPKPPSVFDRLRNVFLFLRMRMLEQVTGKRLNYDLLWDWYWASDNASLSNKKAPWFREPICDYDDIPF